MKIKALNTQLPHRFGKICKFALLFIIFNFQLSIFNSPAQTYPVSLAKEKENPTIGVFQSDILLNGKKVYRNYPEGDLSYKDWDINASLISSYVDEEFGTLYEDKINDSIIFRKGTNEEYNYVEFWWFELVSPKDSIYFKNKDISIQVGNPIEVI